MDMQSDTHLLQRLEILESEVSRLKNEAHFLRIVFDSMEHWVHVWQFVRGDENQILSWRLKLINPAGLAGWEKSLDEVIDKTAEEIFAGATQHFMPLVEGALNTGKPFTWETYFEGEQRYLKMTAVVQGDYFIVVGSDLSAEKKIESDLNNVNEMLSLSLEGAELGTWYSYPQTGKAVFDRRLVQLVGYSAEEIPQTIESWMALVHPDDQSTVESAMQLYNRGDTRIYEAEYRLRHKEGYWLWVLARGKAQRGHDGRVLRMAGTIQDVTTIKKVKEDGVDLLGQIERLIRNLETKPGKISAAQKLIEPHKIRGRRREVLALVGEGLTSREISERLSIAYQTVVTHRKLLMSQLGLRNASELIRYAVENQIKTN